MKTELWKKRMFPVAITTMFFALAVLPAGYAQAAEKMNKAAGTTVDQAAFDQLVNDYPPRPKVAALQMMGKYGLPQEASTETFVWHNPGEYKRIMVTRKEINHDFPKPHMDYLEHTVSYNVPADKADDLLAYDGSVTINRTAGEMSARCDLEGHNILTLNLANDIVTGKKNVEEARKSFGENVVNDVLGKHPEYVEKLQFEPAGDSAMFPDVPVIPGSPLREGQGEAEGDKGDAEVLGFVGAINDNEILAAAAASQKKASPEVLDYAKMMHEEHGENLEQTLKLGEQIGVTPMDTKAVDDLRVKGARELSTLLPLEGDEFGTAYIDAMIKSHKEVLNKIDTQFSAKANNEQIKKHLTDTRGHVATHLEEAMKIQAAMSR